MAKKKRVYKYKIPEYAYGREIGSTVGGIGGALVGSYLLPGLGTSAGMALGSQLGGLAGGAIDDNTGKTDSMGRPREIQPAQVPQNQLFQPQILAQNQIDPFAIQYVKHGGNLDMQQYHNLSQEEYDKNARYNRLRQLGIIQSCEMPQPTYTKELRDELYRQKQSGRLEQDAISELMDPAAYIGLGITGYRLGTKVLPKLLQKNTKTLLPKSTTQTRNIARSGKTM